MSMFKAIFIYCIVHIVKSITVAPTWIAAPEVQANSQRIINGDLCSCYRTSTTGSIPVPFNTAFSTTPRLCYGLSSYQPKDTVYYQRFEVTRTAISTSSFSVSVIIQSYTDIYILQIRYIAVSNSFPYHLNFFHNIPVQYGSSLSNITAEASTAQTYTNTISYTTLAQSISSPFTTFSTPLTNNKILYFMTSLFVSGVDDQSSSVPDYQQVIYFTATPVTSSIFTLSVNFGVKSKISRLKLSFAIFDQLNVESSGKYLLVYNSRICYTSSGGFYQFKSQFLNSFILGFQEYSTARIKSIIHFETNLGIINSTYGAKMPVSIPRSTQNPTATRYCFTYFYIKSWICPNLTVFDPTINACITCTLANCITCITSTTCSLCNATNGYYLNTSTNQCGTCNLVGCTTCITTSTCLTCNSTTYVLNNQTCQYCNPILNYFPNLLTQTCVLCSLSNCLNCSSLTQCLTCNASNSYYLTTGNICAYCNSSLNYFIPPSTSNCVLCTITGCLNCSSLTTCQTCNLTANYLLNTSDNLCYLCGVANCIQCLNFTDCSICDKANGYTLNLTTGECQLCGLVGCTDCTNTEECAKCNNTGNYILLLNKTCQLCLMGLYSNQTSAACQVCTLPNCLVCLTLTTCSSCNTNDSYYQTTTLTCSYCNSSQNYFINTTLDCELCSIPYCLNCSNLTSCIECNQTADYFYNSNDSLCYHCAIAGCIDCNNLTTCAQCNQTADFFYDPLDGKCYSCNITGCIDCLNMTACNVCNAHSNYVLNFISGLCELCTGSAFANYTSNGCQTCNLSYCLICSNLYECNSCDTNSSYYLALDLSCNLCNSSENFFINSTLNCQLCSIPYCLNCSNLTNCSQCNQTADYFYNQSTGQCQTCLLIGCLDCLNISACNICDTHLNFVLNPTTGICDSCPANLYANYTNNICENCTITGCQVCTNLYICSSCNITGSYYLTNVSCSYCNSSENYFINISSLNCEPCIISNCLTCSNLTTCSLCNQNIDFFADPSNGQCFNCAILGCLDCFNLTSCNSSCNSSAGYIFNTTTGRCDLCPIGLFVNNISNACEPCAVANCTTCINLTVCSVCDFNSSFQLVGNQCSYCNNSLNNFISPLTLVCQLCTLLECINCSSLINCSICNITSNYLLDTTDNLCHFCTLPHCLTCQTFTSCSICDSYNGYFLNTSNLCQLCQLIGCQQCDSLTQCQRCDIHSGYLLNSTSGHCQLCNLTGCLHCLSLTVCQQCDIFNGYGFDHTSPNLTLCGTCNVSCSCDGYVVPWIPISQTCTPQCGDGLIRLNQQCDDLNSISGDGCSSTCTIQKYYNCSGEPTLCNLTLYIQSQFVAIQKYGCNGFKITVKILDFSLDQIASNIGFDNDGVRVIKAEPNNSYIDIYAEYNRDITNQTILLKFQPGQTLNIIYNPTIPALYYTESQCSTQIQVQKMLQATQYISYAILIISILSCKIVGLQLFGVLQLSYFTLSSHNYLNMYLAPLTKFKTFNGLNIEIKSQSAELPTSIGKLGIAGSFINNCNIMLLVLFGQLAGSFVLYIVGKIMNSQKIKKIALRLLKQGFVTLVLFNIFNISFSAGVHWKYANPADQSYLLSSIILYGTVIAMVVAVAAMELTAKQDYGEFKNKFKNVWICRLYVPLTVCYRMALGFYTAVETEYDQSTLVILAFSLTFILYVIINLPFSNVFQNYRCALIHITMLFTLLTTNYYRTMKSTTPLQVKGRIYTPAIIQLVLMISCIVASFAVLIYEIYQLIKIWRNQKKTQNIIKQRKNTEQSFENL